MLSCLALVAIGAFYLTDACSKDYTFGAGRIIDLKLDNTESQALIVKINNGIYDYCRSLNVQTGEMGFDEISCTKNALEFTEALRKAVLFSERESITNFHNILTVQTNEYSSLCHNWHIGGR